MGPNDPSTNHGRHEGFCYDANIGSGNFELKLVWKNSYNGWPKAAWNEISFNNVGSQRASQVAFGGGCGCAWRDGNLFSRITGKGGSKKWEKLGTTNVLVQNNQKQTVILKRSGGRVTFSVNGGVKINESAGTLDIHRVCLIPASST